MSDAIPLIDWTHSPETVLGGHVVQYSIAKVAIGWEMHFTPEKFLPPALPNVGGARAAYAAARISIE